MSPCVVYSIWFLSIWPYCSSQLHLWTGRIEAPWPLVVSWSQAPMVVEGFTIDSKALPGCCPLSYSMTKWNFSPSTDLSTGEITLSLSLKHATRFHICWRTGLLIFHLNYPQEVTSAPRIPTPTRELYSWGHLASLWCVWVFSCFFSTSLWIYETLWVILCFGFFLFLSFFSNSHLYWLIKMRPLAHYPGPYRRMIRPLLCCYGGITFSKLFLFCVVLDWSFTGMRSFFSVEKIVSTSWNFFRG